MNNYHIGQATYCSRDLQYEEDAILRSVQGQKVANEANYIHKAPSTMFLNHSARPISRPSLVPTSLGAHVMASGTVPPINSVPIPKSNLSTIEDGSRDPSGIHGSRNNRGTAAYQKKFSLPPIKTRSARSSNRQHSFQASSASSATYKGSSNNQNVLADRQRPKKLDHPARICPEVSLRPRKNKKKRAHFFGEFR